MDKNLKAFLALVRAGLWEKEVRLSRFGEVDFKEVMRIAEMQSVVGLVTAGLEHVSDVKVPQEELLQFIGHTIQLEQCNSAMNSFIEHMVKSMQDNGIYALLVKGQGVAQCYERPLWRSSGDVDFLLNVDNYNKARDFLAPLALQVNEEDQYRLHLGMTIDSWIVELHGTLHTRQLKRVNRVLDKVQEDVFKSGRVRVWKNGETDIFIPAPTHDCFFVFMHIIQHFFGGGIGLRQFCDWCRLLWTYKNEIDERLLEDCLNISGMMSEWKTFAAFAINYLGMPEDVMPLYSKTTRWRLKANKVVDIIMETGSFGHKRKQSNIKGRTRISSNIDSLWRYTRDTARLISVFPVDSVKVWGNMFLYGLKNNL